MIDNILISLSFVFLVRNMNSNEINDLTFKSDRLLRDLESLTARGVVDIYPRVGRYGASEIGGDGTSLVARQDVSRQHLEVVAGGLIVGVFKG